MFKNIKVRSQNPIKSSERKALLDLILINFPRINKDELNQLFPKEEKIILAKIDAKDGLTLVYLVGKEPLFFTIKNQLLPTVFTLWRLPDLVHSFTTHSHVLEILSRGADLMLGGVLTPPSSCQLPPFGHVNAGDVVAVNILGNKAAIAVGLAAKSSDDFFKDAKGKCVIVKHVVKDGLFSLLNPNERVPNLGVNWQNEPLAEEESSIEIIKAEASDEELPQPENEVDLDECLEHAFMVAIKYSKSLQLPILASSFYKLHLLPAVPEGVSLDIKKTSYKKLKPFLEKMQAKGLITLGEKTKGVEMIMKINKDCSFFGEFYLLPDERPRSEEATKASETVTKVTQFYMPSRLTLPVFKFAGLTLTTIILGKEARDLIRTYVTENNCRHPTDDKLIIPDTVLSQICQTKSAITWEELMEKVMANMKKCYEVSKDSDKTIKTGAITPIMMNIFKRKNNKKVTVVKNLELFDINLENFSKECQHGVGASVTINKDFMDKKSELQIQGNQILFVYSLLKDKYKIPIQHIRGLEYAPKVKQ